MRGVHWPFVADVLGEPVSPFLRRRNILLDNLALEDGTSALCVNVGDKPKNATQMPATRAFYFWLRFLD